MSAPRSRLIVELVRCGKLISYAHGQSLQARHIQGLLSGNGPPALLLFEFFPVYTCGFRRSSSIITPEHIERLRALGAHFHETDRGGLITFHGPGQLVAYPIFYLRDKHLSLTLRKYIDRLEQTLVDTCREIIGKTRVYAGTDNGRPVNYAGAWIDNERKVAFMGVRYSRGITSHGVSINCSMNMQWFDHIVPCGFDRRQVTSLSDELPSGKTMTVQQVTPIFLEHFQRIFHVDLRESEQENNVKI